MTAPTSFGPYSTLKGNQIVGSPPTWFPDDAAERIASYFKYDEMYWNDPTQYILRILQGEHPIYVPNARTVVDTTAHYLLKGLKIRSEDPEKYKDTQDALDTLMKREMFYAAFHTAKTQGVARGDWAMHLTADPAKPAGSRLSLTPLDPAQVLPVYDPDNADRLIRLHIVDQYADPKDLAKTRIRKLTYEIVTVQGVKRIQRSEGIFEVHPNWWGPAPVLVNWLIPPGLLPADITTIPVYWFKNLDWLGQQFGSSDLRGLEAPLRAISQQTTDQGTSLSLEGLGVYATDSGRPVDDKGEEEDWEVAPGRVMELISGAYFRRVEGVTSLKPSLDHIDYLETKIREASGLSDVALGRVDVQTAQSGIALAIKFMPTLAKIEQRDLHGIGKLQQLFHDWLIWHQAYEGEQLEGEIVVEIGDKLPGNRTETVNELNNMLDRGVISRQYYRAKMTKLGYEFPDDIEGQIEAEKTKDAEISALTAPPGLQDNAVAAAQGEKPPPQSAGGAQNAPRDAGPSRSNNARRPNESAGTESGQTLHRQARGGTPPGGKQR